jgi:hypothetical protein
MSDDLQAKLERWAADDSDPERHGFALELLDGKGHQAFNDQLRADAKQATQRQSRARLARRIGDAT